MLTKRGVHTWCTYMSRPVPKKGPKKPTRFFLLLSSKAIKKFSLVFLGPFWGQGVKCQNAVFWHSESPQTHNTRNATHCRHHMRPVFLPGSSLASFGKSPAARKTQDGPTTPPKRRSGQRRERHLGRSWWSLIWHVASTGRALLPAVRHPTKPAKSNDAKKSICA